MSVFSLGNRDPRIPASAYVADEATVVGDVTLGEGASVWPGAVIRGDNEPIRLGAATNVQDSAVLHTDPGVPLTIGDNVTIGHHAMLHGCTIGDGSLVGIKAVVMDRAVIGKSCLVAAAAVVVEGQVFPDRSLILGSPARVVRPLTEAELASLQASAESYRKRGSEYKARLKKVG